MKKDDRKSFWQRMAKGYTLFMKGNARACREAAAAIVPFLRKDMDMLELACGTGQMTFLLHDRVRLYMATDFSPAMVAQGEKRRPYAPELVFAVEDATELSYAKDSFDAVLIANALHIMPDADRVLKEIGRVLKPGGLLFAPTFVQGKNPAARIHSRFMQKVLGLKVYHAWDERGLTDYLEQRGFKVTAHRLMGARNLPMCFIAARKQAR